MKRPPPRPFSHPASSWRLGRTPRAVGRLAVLSAAGLVLVWLALAQPASVLAAAASADKIAVLPLEIGGEIPAGRPALEIAVVKGLLVTGRTVVVGPDVATTLSKAGARVACADPACWKAAGRALGAAHLLTGVIDQRAGSFEAEFRLVDAVQGRVLLSELNRCDVSDCSVAELCRMTVHELARAALPEDDARPDVAAGAGPAAPGPVGGAPATPPAANPAVKPVAGRGAPSSTGGVADPSVLAARAGTQPEDGPAWPASWSSWYPMAAIGTGVVASAAGAWLIAKDGKCLNERRCRDHYQTFWGGMASAGAGAILVASGIVVGLVGSNDESEARARPATGLAVGPGAISYSGRFD